MGNDNNQNLLDDPGDVNPIVRESVYNHIHIWHEVNANKAFVPVRKLTVKKALSFINRNIRLSKMSVIEVNEENVKPHISGFTRAVSLGGMYWPVSITRIVIPTTVKDEVEDYISRYELSKYRDLIWYLIARLQIFYTQRKTFGGIGDKKHTKLIYNSRENFVAMQKVVQYASDCIRNINNKTRVTLTIKQPGFKHTIKDQWMIMFLMDGFIKEFVDKEGELIPNWKDKIVNFEGSHAIKDSQEHIHRNFAIAFMEFLKRQDIVTGNKITAEYLNPVIDLLNISQYPFINDGDTVTIKHIRSVLKSTTYSLPTE